LYQIENNSTKKNRKKRKRKEKKKKVHLVISRRFGDRWFSYLAYFTFHFLVQRESSHLLVNFFLFLIKAKQGFISFFPIQIGQVPLVLVVMAIANKQWLPIIPSFQTGVNCDPARVT